MEQKCKKIVQKLKENNKTIAFMESCTGGFLANAITNISGASEVLKMSLVTYSNEYKIKFGIDRNIIEKYTVYSIETAQEMSKVVAQLANSDIGVGVTGELGNTDKKENKVYYTIYKNDSKEYINKEIIVKQNKRGNMKKEVAQKILTDILEGIE